MIGFDFDIFWKAARALLAGQSPYTASNFYSPLPFAWFMAPFGLLPFEAAFGLWTILNLISLVALSRKNALRLILFLPVFFALWVGQIDLIILAAGLSGSWLGLGFTTLKPQLALWIMPYMFLRWWRLGERKKILYTLLVSLVIYGLPSLIQPGWWQEWRAASPSIFFYAERAASLFGMAALIPIPGPITFGAVLILAGLSFSLAKPFFSERYWAWVALFNPIASIYSLSVLVNQVDWLAIGLSWALLPFSLYLHTGLPWALIPLYLLWRSDRYKPLLSTPSSGNPGES